MKAADGIWRGWIWRVVWETSRPWGCTYKGKLIRVGLLRPDPIVAGGMVTNPFLLVLGPLGVSVGKLRPYPPPDLLECAHGTCGKCGVETHPWCFRQKGG